MSASNKTYQFISVSVVKLLSETSSTKFSLSSVSFYKETHVLKKANFEVEVGFLKDYSGTFILLNVRQAVFERTI